MDFDNIQIKNALSLYRFRADEMGRQYAHLAHVRDRWKFKTKVHFDFRVMPDLPSQAFEHPTLLCLKKPDSTSFFYYPARVLEHYPVSIDQLKHAQWGDNYVIDYRVNRYQLAPWESVEISVNEKMPSLPAIIQHGEEHWVYGKTLEGLRLNRIEAQMAQQDDFELSMWIYEKAFHIPLIRYQKDYPIFNKIKQILDSRTTLKAPDYPYIHLIEDGDNLQMEAGHLYVKKNDYDHRLTVSLIACSGQSIDNLETNIELHADHLSETDSAAIKNFLKTERLIPFLERTQNNFFIKKRVSCSNLLNEVYQMHKIKPGIKSLIKHP